MAVNLKELLKRENKPKKQRILIMGDSGVGKTSLARCFKKPLFVQPQGEEGIETLINNKVCPPCAFLPACESWEDLRAYTQALIENNEKIDFETVVFDGLGSIEDLLHQHVCAEKFGGDMGESGFIGWMRGYKLSIPYLRDWLAQLDVLRDCDKTIILLGHSANKTYRNAHGADYGKVQLDLHASTAEAIKRWSDFMLYYTFEVDTVTKDKKATGNTRVLHTSPDASFDAKNRYVGIEPTIDAGGSHEECYRNLVDAIKKATSK